MQISTRCSHVLKGKMEGIMILVAEWYSLEEMKALQEVCTLTSVWAREWQHMELLSDLDDQMWRDLSDDWQKYLSEKKKAPPCEPKLCPVSFQNKRNEFPAENFGNQKVSALLLAQSCGEKTQKEYFPCAAVICTMSGNARRYVWRSSTGGSERSLGFCVLSSLGQNVFESWGRLRFKNWSVPVRTCGMKACEGLRQRQCGRCDL